MLHKEKCMYGAQKEVHMVHREKCTWHMGKVATQTAGVCCGVQVEHTMKIVW